MDLPILPETYWNPYLKELCVDETLSQVITSPKWTVEESRKATDESWFVHLSSLSLTSLPSPALSFSQGGSSRRVGEGRHAHLSDPR
jgi:hypothetical protein